MLGQAHDQIVGARLPTANEHASACVVIFDFLVGDVDAEYPRIAALGVGLVLPPTTQPWGSRSMVFTDPEGNLVNVFSRPGGPA